MNGFRTSDFNRTGRAGKTIGVGKSEEPRGASRAINLDHNNRDRNEDNSGNRNIIRGLRFSNISNGDNSNRDNLRREFSNRKDKSKGLRFSNHNPLSLKENLKEGR
jgi:hypothetical protein